MQNTLHQIIPESKLKMATANILQDDGKNIALWHRNYRNGSLGKSIEHIAEIYPLKKKI